jgi:hypothetical protein
MIYYFAIAFLLTGSDATPQTADKEIVYKKETFVDLSGSSVDGEKIAPPAFFVTKTDGPNARRLLEERLNFKLERFNRFGF